MPPVGRALGAEKAPPPALAHAGGGAAFVHEGLREPSMGRIATSCR